MTGLASSPSPVPHASAKCRCDTDIRARGVCSPCYDRWDYFRNWDRKRSHNIAWQMRNRDRKHLTHVKRTYGLSASGYDALLAFQRHRCAICGVHEDSLPSRLCIDHSHSSGVVRGALCRLCNAAVGSAEKHNTGAFSYYTLYPPMREMQEREKNPHGPHPA